MPHSEVSNKQEYTTIFRSKLPDIPIPNHLPLHTYLFQNIAHFADRPCLIDAATGHVLTYADLHLTSRKVAAGLYSKLGLRRGDVIMLLLPNCPEFPLAFLAASSIGTITTTANPLFSPTEVIKQVESSGAKLVVAQACNVHKFKDYATEGRGLKIVCIDDAPELQHLNLDLDFLHFSELCSADEADLPEVEINPDDTVTLPFSSGTTGLPKGTLLTHKSIVTNVAQQFDGENPHVYLHSEDVILAMLPLFHIFGLIEQLIGGLRVGAAIVLMQRFEMAAFLELIHRYRVTFFAAVPPVAVSLVKTDIIHKYDLSSVRMVMFGAAPLGKGLEDAVRYKFPNAVVAQAYGMTEGGPAISLSLGFAKSSYPASKSGSSGTLVRNAEMKIIHTETGDSLGYNEAGVICIRGDQIMKGYLNNPEATKQTIDEDGWLRTGDVGFVDEDDEVFIVDRVKEMIKYNGYQVSPAEIEAILFAHPSIQDAAVVPMEDEKTGEIPVAFIVRSNGSRTTEEEIMQFVREQLVFYKRIRRVFFIQKIPKSNTGKILRKQLKALLSEKIVPAVC